MLPNCEELKSKNPEKSKLMEVRINQSWWRGRTYKISHRWVKLGNIAPDLIKAVVASEDFSFFWHEGVDLAELWIVIKDSLQNFEFPRGASTITQQLAKNIYLADSWTVTRKFKEIIVAKRLEQVLSKKRILELYLNYIEWGEGIFGAEAAAQYYFNKPASSISNSEALFLAAIIPRPLKQYSPDNPDKRTKYLIRIIQKRMDALKMEGL